MNALLAALSVALGAAVALTLPGGSAAVLLCASVALAAGFLLGKVEQPQRAFVLRVFVAALLIRVAVGTLINAFQLQDFFGGDALTYDLFGNSVMESWRAGVPQATEVKDWASAGGGWGMIYMVGQVLLALGFTIVVLVMLSRTVPMNKLLRVSELHDIGNLTLAFVMLPKIASRSPSSSAM